ncbi:MAG: hypothetical protein U0667_14820 [Chloroflexota bacterium]
MTSAAPAANAAASAEPTPRVRIGAVGKSLCAALSAKQVGKAIGVKMRASNEVDHCEWHASEFGDPEVVVSLAWAGEGIEATKARHAADPGATTLTDLTVGGHPALRSGGTYPPSLLIELDQGTLQLSAADPYGGDYSAALAPLGELAVAEAASLVPLPPGDPVLAGLFPATVGDLVFDAHVAYPEKVFSKDTGRDDLRKALKKADRTLADVSLQSGIAYAGNDSVIVNALRVAGADASRFARFGINAAGLWGDFPPVPNPVPNGSIGVVRMPSGDPMYVYPKDDIVWVVLGDDSLVDQVFAALPGAPDRSALPTPTPAPTPDLSSPEGYFRSLLPATLGGQPWNIDASPAKAALNADGRKRFKAILAAQGKTIDDLTVANAFNGNVSIQAFRVAGGDAAPLEPVLIKELRDSGVVAKSSKPTAAEVAGKAMRSIDTLFGPAYLYPSGEVMWVVSQADDAILEELFAALP